MVCKTRKRFIEEGGIFFEKIEGDFYNVLGLPLGMLYTKLNELGYRLDDFEC